MGSFIAHGGTRLDWKVECDDLSAEDWGCAAFDLALHLPPFIAVHGIPRGGDRLAGALRHYLTVPVPGTRSTILLVDDVLTTGGSMERARSSFRDAYPADRYDILGAVVFARGPLPGWVRAWWVYGLGDRP